MKMNRIYLTVSVIGFLTLCTIAACKKAASGGDNNSLFGTFDQKAMLTDISNNVIVPSIKSFADASETFIAKANAFVNNPQASTLSDAQNGFNQLALSWAKIAPFDFGPVGDNLWFAQIDTWPVNPTKIQNAVASDAEASTQGADAKGLKTLEYLLFDKRGNDAVLARYTEGGAAATHFKNYLASVSANLLSLSSKLHSSWIGSNDYKSTFSNSRGNDVSSSASLLVNSLSLYLDEMKNMKVGNPIGMGVKVNDGAMHPDKIEYQLAEESLPVMIANLQSMKAAFDGASGQGLDDLLDYVKAKQDGKDLSWVIDEQFDDVISKLDAITPPFVGAVTGETQKLVEVFNSLKQLIVYFKVDVANNLGITITFSDTDGD